MFKIRWLLIFCICISIFSCANLNDSWTDLGNGYTYHTDSDLRWITTDYVTKEGVYPNVTAYVFDDNFILVCQKPSIKGYQFVLYEDLRSRYDFALNLNSDTSKYDINDKRFLKSHLWIDSNIHKKMAREILPDNQASFEKISIIADSIIKYDPYYKRSLSRKIQYWIIKKKQEFVLGPFSFQEYQHKRIELKIPTTLELKTNEKT